MSSTRRNSYLLAQATATHLPLREASVQCVVTSPPYWGLRQYAGEQREVWAGEPEHAHTWEALPTAEGYAGTARWQHTNNGRGEFQPTEKTLRDPITRATRPEAWTQVDRGGFCACGAWYGALGLEPTPELYVEHIVAIFREVRRVLRPDGTLWLNLGDSYAGSWGAQGRDGEMAGRSVMSARQIGEHPRFDSRTGARGLGAGLKAKDLAGIPWRVAFALQADGWWLRSDIIWSKPNPMPESIRDRPTKAHEYVFLLSKSATYYYDADAIREPLQQSSLDRVAQNNGHPTFDSARRRRDLGHIRGQDTLRPDQLVPNGGRNARSVWTIATQPYSGAHFATLPEELARRCILAGSSPQACGVCGAPWARMTGESEFIGGRGSGNKERRIAGAAADNGRLNTHMGSSVPWSPTAIPTLGWRPTCAHDDLGGGRSVVLDPFVGSGTVARVARRLGRAGVGFDLSREYLSEQALGRVDSLAAAQHEARDGEGERQLTMDVG